jgi:site-specific recombinase XerC
LLSTCAGVSFCDRRDTALIRLFMDTGARLAEGTLIARGDVDLDGQVVLVRGKGGHQRRVPFGEKTALALVRYGRVRARHVGAELPALFLSVRGVAMSTNAVKEMFTRRGRAAGVNDMPCVSGRGVLRGGDRSWLAAARLSCVRVETCLVGRKSTESCWGWVSVGIESGLP